MSSKAGKSRAFAVQPSAWYVRRSRQREELRGRGFQGDDIRQNPLDIARIYFYMADRYALSYPTDMKSMLEAWNVADPVSAKERERNDRIRSLQGHANGSVSE